MSNVGSMSPPCDEASALTSVHAELTSLRALCAELHASQEALQLGLVEERRAREGLEALVSQALDGGTLGRMRGPEGNRSVAVASSCPVRIGINPELETRILASLENTGGAGAVFECGNSVSRRPPSSASAKSSLCATRDANIIVRDAAVVGSGVASPQPASPELQAQLSATPDVNTVVAVRAPDQNGGSGPASECVATNAGGGVLEAEGSSTSPSLPCRTPCSPVPLLALPSPARAGGAPPRAPVSAADASRGIRSLTKKSVSDLGPARVSDMMAPSPRLCAIQPAAVDVSPEPVSARVKPSCEPKPSPLAPTADTSGDKVSTRVESLDRTAPPGYAPLGIRPSNTVEGAQPVEITQQLQAMEERWRKLRSETVLLRNILQDPREPFLDAAIDVTAASPARSYPPIPRQVTF